MKNKYLVILIVSMIFAVSCKKNDDISRTNDVGVLGQGIEDVAVYKYDTGAKLFVKENNLSIKSGMKIHTIDNFNTGKPMVFPVSMEIDPGKFARINLVAIKFNKNDSIQNMHFVLQHCFDWYETESLENKTLTSNMALCQ